MIMRRGFGFAVASGLIAATAFAADTEAQSRRNSSAVEATMQPTSGSDRRSKAQVRGYVQRRGGYSYSPEDVINTYGDSRTLYGGANAYRDPRLDRQSPFGPFDSGFFFDSHGRDSPYQH
jgi:hypothetical protein